MPANCVTCQSLVVNHYSYEYIRFLNLSVVPNFNYGIMVSDPTGPSLHMISFVEFSSVVLSLFTRYGIGRAGTVTKLSNVYVKHTERCKFDDVIHVCL